MQISGRRHFFAVLMLSIFAWSGCEPSNSSAGKSGAVVEDKAVDEAQAGREQAMELESVEGGFFDDESLLAGAVDIAAEEAAVVCVGQGIDVFGMVLAPHAQMAMKWQFPDWLVSRAEASPLSGELPVGDVPVRLYRVDGKGVQSGEDFAGTRTTSGGRFCVRLPQGVEPGVTIVVEAAAKDGGKEIRLRRFLLNAEDADVHLASESFVQILLENDIDLTRAPLVNLMNLEVYAQTAIDLLNPVELSDEGGVEAGVELVKKTLLADERFSAGLKRLQKASK